MKAKKQKKAQLELERQKAAQKEKERMEKENEEAKARLAEENRLKKTIKQYEDVAAKVSKMKTFAYKNGKLKVTLLRATDIEDKDKSLRKGDLSDVLVKFKVPGSKHSKSSVIKDSRNPVWKGQIFVFDVQNPLKDVLTCDVLDHDTMVNDYIGKVEIAIVDVVKAEEALLKSAKYAIKGSKKGCLYLDLQYYEK